MNKMKKIIAGLALVSTVSFGYQAIADADVYTVKSGDTLWTIAKNNQTTVEKLMKDNNLTSDLIFPGDELSFDVTTNHVAKAESEGTYVVKAGDSLYKIANKLGLSVDELVKHNNIVNPNQIKIGQVLNLKAPVVPAETVAPVEASEAVEKVKEAAPEVVEEATSQETAVFKTVFTAVANNYAYAQCTWYAHERRTALGNPMPHSYFGNGGDWYLTAMNLGMSVDHTPQVGDVVSFPAGVYGASVPWGHVAVVEQVNADGSFVVSEMHGGNPTLHYRTIPAYVAAYAYFIH